MQATASKTTGEDDQEVLELTVKNSGPMTALFCEPHPLIEYRNDLFIENNHCFIPPGESRIITIRAANQRGGGLTLAQTGWRLSCWNAADVIIEPGSDVLLALGRRDALGREFAGYFDPGTVSEASRVQVQGTRPDPARVPYLLDGNRVVQFEFSLSEAQARRPARLRIHAADQSDKLPTHVAAKLNRRAIEGILPVGLGIQRSDPAHLAFPGTVEFTVPASDLRSGKNVLEIRVQDDGWFSWDAMDLTNHD